MSKKVISSSRLRASASPFSQGVLAGPLVFTSGMGGIDPATGKLAGETVGEQTAQSLSNIRCVLEEAGLGFEDVVKVTVHLLDIDRDFQAFNESYGQCVAPPYPVRTTVGSRLGGGMLVEIDVVAVRRSGAEAEGTGA